MLNSNNRIVPLDCEPRHVVKKEARLSASAAENLALALERELEPIIRECIRDAVRDSARQLARDLRKRLDADLPLMIREAIDQTQHS